MDSLRGIVAENLVHPGSEVEAYLKGAFPSWSKPRTVSVVASRGLMISGIDEVIYGVSGLVPAFLCFGQVGVLVVYRPSMVVLLNSRHFSEGVPFSWSQKFIF